MHNTLITGLTFANKADFLHCLSPPDPRIRFLSIKSFIIRFELSVKRIINSSELSPFSNHHLDIKDDSITSWQEGVNIGALPHLDIMTNQ